MTAVPRGPRLPPTPLPSPPNLLLQRWGLRRESLSVVPPPQSAGGVINHDIYFLRRRKLGRGDFKGRKSLGTLPPTRCFFSAPSPHVGGFRGTLRSARSRAALKRGVVSQNGEGGVGARRPPGAGTPPGVVPPPCAVVLGLRAHPLGMEVSWFAGE